MRPLLIVAILALAMLPLPGARAAEPLLADPAGDAAYVTSANGAPVGSLPLAAGFEKGSDLVALSVGETEETLEVTLSVASVEGETGLQSRTLLAWGAKDYAVEIGFFNPPGSGPGSFRWAALLVRQGNDYEAVADLDEPILDGAAGSLTASVPKVYLLDEDLRTPGRGDTIDISQVIADTNFVDFGLAGMRVNDAMPDAEGKGASFTLALGDQSRGDLVLTTPERVRVSNGGATTFVFTLTLRNVGDAEHEFGLAAQDLPDGWNATLRTPVTVAPKSEKAVSLLLSVPFAHEHGGYSSFNVTAQSTRDAGTNARMRLGVLHTPIPQPAGHHSELFLHSRDPRTGTTTQVFSTVFPFGSGWMNTQEDHAEDAALVTPNGGDADEVTWRIPLNPSLQMGLDFDVESLGAIEGTLLAGRDGAADLAAELYYYRGDPFDGDATLLAEAEPVGVTLAQQGASAFELTLTPTPEADYIPYAPDSGMYLILSMQGADVRDRFANTPLKVQLETATFKMALPLNEYHDRLSGEADVAQAITILAKGLVEKAARPGSVLTYAFDVRNDGPADTFVLDLAGNDVAHARLIPIGGIALETGASREVTLAVEIPIDANPGQEYEVLLFVHARDDPSKMAIARTKTKATDVAEEAMPDESGALLAAQARENPTPGWGLGALVLAVALALGVARGRRLERPPRG